MLYIALVLTLELFVKVHHFSVAISFLLCLPFIVPELIGDYRPDYLAGVFVYRKTVVASVLIFFTLIGLLAFVQYPYPVALWNSFDANKDLLRELSTEKFGNGYDHPHAADPPLLSVNKEQERLSC